MKRLLHTVLTVGSSRAVPPIVIGLFFLVYLGIAFFTDETLITLMAFTRKSIILAALLALIPLNSAFSLVRETLGYLKMSRVLAGKDPETPSDLFDEMVSLPAYPAPAATALIPAPRSPIPEVAELEGRLAAEGYKTRRSESTLAAWRGISLFPARLLFLTGTFCLFAGILISITTRTSYRQMVIEGESMPTPTGTGGIVERIILADSIGPILKRTLDMEVAPSGAGYGKRTFGLYPPSLYGGAFVYPRYLGVAIHMRFTAPDMQTVHEARSNLNCYPPGREDSVPIPGSPYKIIFSIPEPAAGSDRYISYTSGGTALTFKLLKGKDLLVTGSVPSGGEFVRDGYRLSIPDIRRLVVTDFIGDYGVLFIWATALLIAAALLVWLPIRVFFPRRVILFRFEAHETKAFSRAEGGARKHAGVFHEALDLVDARKG
jgi:hypothetical protein